MADDKRVVVLVSGHGSNLQALLDAARAAGRVVTFVRELPSLADTFRQVVAR